MDDAADAVAWTRAHIASLGGDPHRLFLMGHSAGAQIATLLALDPRYLRHDARSRQADICGVIGLAGPYDFLPLHDAELKLIFGPEDERPRSQPINYVTPQAPPMLLLAGQDDDVVKAREHAAARRAAACRRGRGARRVVSRHWARGTNRDVRRTAPVPRAGAAGGAGLHPRA